MLRKSFLIQLVLFTWSFLVFSPQIQAADLKGRMGLGMSNQLSSGLPAISFKMQQSSIWAIGGLVGAKINDTNGGYGVGIKGYRLVFDEPQLSFYFSGLAALNQDKKATVSTTGYQIDGTMGSEFSFQGLESLGFSFEFGLSFQKRDKDFVIQTAGYHFLTAGVHFYL